MPDDTETAIFSTIAIIGQPGEDISGSNDRQAGGVRRGEGADRLSLIGIDLGSSAIKVGAYAHDGRSLAAAKRVVPAYRPEPGHSEVDVFESREAFLSAVGEVAGHPSLKADPAVAISFSSSAGRSSRSPRTARPGSLPDDLRHPRRRGRRARQPAAARPRSGSAWPATCRAGWTRSTGPCGGAGPTPGTAARTRWFMNWHEYYAL